MLVTLVMWMTSSLVASIVIGSLLYVGSGSSSHGPRQLRDGSDGELRELHRRAQGARLHEGVEVVR